MYRNFLLVVFLFGVSIVYSQDDVTISRRNIPGSNNELPKSTFSIDPMGLFMLGPQIAGEYRIGKSKGYISPQVRYGFLGLLTHLSFASEGRRATVSPVNYGVGLAYRGFITSDQTSNVLYLGGGFEYNSGSAYYDRNDQVLEAKSEVSGIAFALNFGYRWRALENKFIGVGLQAGVNYFLDNRFYYTLDNEEIDNLTGGTLLFGVLQLTYGWEKY